MLTVETDYCMQIPYFTGEPENNEDGVHYLTTTNSYRY